MKKILFGLLCLTCLIAHGQKSVFFPAYGASGNVTINNTGGGSSQVLLSTQYGIIPSPTFNAGARIQAIIDSLEAINAPGTIFLMHGDYYAWLTTKATNYVTARITIHKRGIQLVGENPYTTTIHFRGTGNTDPLTHADAFFDQSHGFAPFDTWVSVRSPGIKIDAASDGVGGIAIKNLHLDGGTGWTGHYYYPVTDTVGLDGWDPSNQGIEFSEAHYTVGVVIENNIIDHFRGELLWSGSVGHRNGLIYHNTLSSTNGSAISTSAFDGLIFANDISNAVNGVENYPGTPYNQVTYEVAFNHVHFIRGIDINTGDTSKGNGIIIGGAVINSADRQHGSIHDNIYDSIKEAGILVIRSTRNLKIQNESMKDVGYGVNLQPFSGSIQDITVSSCDIRAEQWNMAFGIFVQGNAGPMHNIFIENNKVWVTDVGLYKGTTINTGLGFIGCDSTVVMRNNIIFAQHGIDGSSVSSNTHYPICYNNQYLNPGSNDYVIGFATSGSVNVGGMEIQRLLNSPDNAGVVLDIVYPWTKLLAGSRFKLVNLSTNTQLRLNTGTNYMVTTPILLGRFDEVEMEWTSFGKMKIISSTTKW